MTIEEVLVLIRCQRPEWRGRIQTIFDAFASDGYWSTYGKVPSGPLGLQLMELGFGRLSLDKFTIYPGDKGRCP